MLSTPGSTTEYLVARVERTSTKDCAPLPGNAHVTCDTSGQMERLSGLESIGVLRLKYFLYEFNDTCSISVSKG